MSYQFELNRSNRSLRFPVIMMAVIVSMVVAAYVIAACSDHTPNQARASEVPATNVPVTSTSTTTSTEKPSTLVISGPVTFEMADSAISNVTGPLMTSVDGFSVLVVVLVLVTGTLVAGTSLARAWLGV